MVTIRYTTSDTNDASKMFIRLTRGDVQADTKNTRNTNCTSFSPCQKTIEKHIQKAHYVSSLCEDV